MKIPKIRHAFSPSFLKKFKACQRSAIFDTFKQSAATEFGSAVHKLLEDVFRPGADTEEMKHLFISYIVNKLKNGELSHLDYKKYLDKAYKISAFLKGGAFDPPEGTTVFDVECSHALPDEFKQSFYGKTFFEVPILQDGKKIRGQMDIVYAGEGLVWARDWKTGSAKNDPFQLNIYILALITAYDLHPEQVTVQGDYMYVEEGKSVFIPYDEKELIKTIDLVQETVNRYYNAYQMKLFTATPSWDNCMFCTVEDCQDRKGERR